MGSAGDPCTIAGKAVICVAFRAAGGVMSAVSLQVDSVREGVWWRVLCHRLGRMVNNLTYMDPSVMSRSSRTAQHM